MPHPFIVSHFPPSSNGTKSFSKWQAKKNHGTTVVLRCVTVENQTLILTDVSELGDSWGVDLLPITPSGREGGLQSVFR